MSRVYQAPRTTIRQALAERAERLAWAVYRVLFRRRDMRAIEARLARIAAGNAVREGRR